MKSTNSHQEEFKVRSTTENLENEKCFSSLGNLKFYQKIGEKTI